MTYDRAALDLVGAMTNAELADFIREARQPAPMTRDDVAQLYKERRYSEIEQARADGRLDHLMTGDEK